MPQTMPEPLRWAGPVLIAIGFLHTFVMIGLFHGVYLEILAAGLVDTINEHVSPLRGAAFWALQFGFLLILVGLLLPIDRTPVGKEVGIMLLFVVSLGIVIMPAGGFWLALPVALGLLRWG